jgi:hypothetical protein
MIGSFCLAIAFMFCADFHLQSVKAEVILPTDLNPGDKYQIIFVTEGTIDATSPDISVYNAFVTSEAGKSGDLPSADWYAVASTTSIDAKNNAVAYADVPIYNTQGERIANGLADLWDGAILNAIQYDQYGTTLGDTFVWTGSNANGTRKYLYGSSSGPLGSPAPDDPTDPHVVFGSSTQSDSKWLKNGTFVDFYETHSLYALSGVVYIAPEPGTLMLLCTSILAFVFYNRRR